MAMTVKKTAIWRREVDNRPGALAQTLEPLAGAGVDLEVVMGYGIGDHRAAIEVAPVTGKRATAAAEKAGLAESRVPAVLVTGDNKAGLGHALSKAIGDAGININFLIAQVIGNRFSSVFGFESEADADRAVPIMRNAAAQRRPKTAARRLPVARA